MKKLFTFILLIILPIALYSQGFNSIHSFDGVNVLAVGDSGKIYRSTNSGNSWYIGKYSSNNLKSVYVIGNNVWISGDSGIVYKTNIQLNFFSVIETGENFIINSIYFVNYNIGFLCGEAGRIYKTLNGGLNWSLINTGVDLVKYNSISFKDTENGVVVGDNGKIYTTLNGGLNWNSEAISTNKNLLKVKYFSNGITVVGEYGTLFMRENTFSWTQINTRINTDIRSVTGTSQNDIHICGGGGFIRNNKNGSSNFLNFEINPVFGNLVDIYYCNTNLGFAISSLNRVVIRTTNGGLSWDLPPGTSMKGNWVVKLNPSQIGAKGNNLCVHPTNANTIFTNFRGWTYVSRDRGENWTQVGTRIATSVTPHSFYVTLPDTNVWVCAIEASTGDKVVRSTDYGQTWSTSLTMNFSNYGRPLEMDQNNSGIFYFAPIKGGFFKSTDNGITFNEISNYPFRNVTDIMVTFDEPNTIFLSDGYTGSGRADVFKSTNGGINWSLKFTNPVSSQIQELSNTIFNNKIIWLTNWPGYAIYKSTNAGENWHLNHSNSFAGWGIDVCSEDPNFIMSGTYSDSGQTSMSSNGGISWNTITGLTGAGGVMNLTDRGFVIGQTNNTISKLYFSYLTKDTSFIIPTPIMKINLKVFSEGIYDSLSGQLFRKDTLQVFLRDISAPYSAIDSAVSALDSLSLSGLFIFPNAVSGNYYIEVKHFNSIETWSKPGGEILLLNDIPNNYDFSTTSSQAYGNNLKLKNGKYCLFSGDVNQDGYITLYDLIPVYNGSVDSVTGKFLNIDLNGDSIVDLNDVTLCNNNSINFVSVLKP